MKKCSVKMLMYRITGCAFSWYILAQLQGHHIMCHAFNWYILAQLQWLHRAMLIYTKLIWLYIHNYCQKQYTVIKENYCLKAWMRGRQDALCLPGEDACWLFLFHHSGKLPNKGSGQHRLKSVERFLIIPWDFCSWIWYCFSSGMCLAWCRFRSTQYFW